MSWKWIDKPIFHGVCSWSFYKMNPRKEFFNRKKPYRNTFGLWSGLVSILKLVFKMFIYIYVCICINLIELLKQRLVSIEFFTLFFFIYRPLVEKIHHWILWTSLDHRNFLLWTMSISSFINIMNTIRIDTVRTFRE